MKKIVFILIAICWGICSQAQSIIAAEFFVDTDPGVGNATSVNITSPGVNVNFAASVPAASLTPGFHLVGIRTKDNLGKWGLFEIRGVFISTAGINAGNIVAAEFFIDSDPGVGNATPITPITAGTNPQFAATIPTAALSNGFHFVTIRVKDADGKWGLMENRGFFISAGNANVSNIVSAEYFIDTDPGVGNGTAIAAFTAGANVTFMATVPTTSLTVGFHFVTIRVKDATGKWSLMENRGFFISAGNANVSNIVSAEYFIDTDPGVGNGIAVAPFTAGNNPILVASVPAASLSNGFHFVAIRTKDADGKWGLFEKRGFVISTQTGNVPNIVAAEYFIDADPGVGNAVALVVPVATSFSQNFALNVPAGTTNGTHIVAVRIKNADGVWSLYEFVQFNVFGTLPLRLLSFDAAKNGKTVYTKWRTDNEVNTAHFEVERSVNGVEFKKVGTVAALNRSGINQYSFEDNGPAAGVNFYRLKQVDLDGRFEYSTTVKIFFNAAHNLIIYPNPVTYQLKIQLPGSPAKWTSSIYDAAGKLLQQKMNNGGNLLELSVSQLAKGSYVLVLNNGLEIYTGQFLKQ